MILVAVLVLVIIGLCLTVLALKGDADYQNNMLHEELERQRAEISKLLGTGSREENTGYPVGAEHINADERR